MDPKAKYEAPEGLIPELGKSYAFAAAFSKTSNIEFALYDTGLCFVFVNNAAAAITGILPKIYLGNTMWDIIGDAAGEHQARLRRVLTTKETPAVEITALLPTRTEFGFWIHKIFPVRGRSGKITQIGSLAVEVTDSRKLEDRFRRLAAQPLWSEKDYQGLSKELHDSINAYHRSIAMNLNRLSQQVDEPERIPDVVAHSMVELDQRMAKLASTIAMCFSTWNAQ